MIAREPLDLPRRVYDWMGRYPRKGADWSPDEDQALMRAYESGRHLTKEIAARHLREPVAIERRLSLLRDRAQMKQEHDLDAAASHARSLGAKVGRNWQTERETAQQAVSQIKELFAKSMWPDGRSKTPKQLKPGELVAALDRAEVHPGDVVGVYVCVEEHSFWNMPMGVVFRGVPLTDLPPEVAQALQFGGES